MGADPNRLRAVLDGLGLGYRNGPKSYIFTCPICKKPRKLYIRKSDGLFRCWVCGPTARRFQGAPEFALAELSGRRVADLRRDLYGASVPVVAGYLDAELDLFGAQDEGEPEEAAPLPDLAWPYHCHPLDHKWAGPGVAYLAGRGVPVELAARYDLRYSPRERAIAIPAWIGDRLVGWQYRTIDPIRVELPDGRVVERLRVWSDAAIPRDRVVLFRNRVVGPDVLLCEGPFDAIAGDLVGGNVATMGTAVSTGQILELVHAGVRRIYVAFDPDAADVLELLAQRLLGVVALYKVAIPAPYKDLGEVPPEAVPALVRAAAALLPGQIHLHLKGLERLGLTPGGDRGTVQDPHG